MSKEQWREETVRVKSKYSKKELTQRHLFHCKTHTNYPEFESEASRSETGDWQPEP